ncbi:MAG: tRNA pseudouridine(38-40) synthase TruA [Alphaproteobacteria bacterium]|jgi:tRNA pseudouridine38-40 synthase|nr:tRNA pseudouridine(38-40) synthase TruA [Alphaproteobacteria bacterium]MCV6599224.1 tRNA pseudouridine(38-40) synthase TruA [Alphaproteobacteria bacterium]
MQRWKIIIEYDGTSLYGWQKQKGFLSVQEIVENALEKFSKEKIEIYGSGRTDTGVHSTGQVAHFDMERDMEEFQVFEALNSFLKKSPVAIISAEKIDNSFHARFDAKLRHYTYKILNRKAPTSLNRYRMWHFKYDLDIEAMQEAANFLIGKHDFSSFRAANCQSNSPIKSIERISFHKEGDVISMDISAKSFMYHQVRNIIGTLVDVGNGRTSVKEFKDILEAKDRTKAGITAPACGLYFTRIDY